MTSPAVPSSGAEVLDLPLDSLQDSPFQVKRYDDARVRDLAETIRKQGLLQPATVRRVGDGYELIAGHGRRAAVRYLRDKVATTEADKARYAALRCVDLEDVDDARAAALTAIETLQRDDGTELEQALMVARARAAGAYRSAAEVAEALGFKPKRVRYLLELADAPAVIQEAVDPGVLVPGKPGTRVRLLLTNALATRPFYDLVFEDELARLKAKKRVVLATGDVELRAAETERLRELARGLATERTGQLLARAARGVWTVKQIEKFVRSAIERRKAEAAPRVADAVADAGADASPEGLTPVEQPKALRLFERRGGRFILYPDAFGGGEPEVRAALVGHLRAFLATLQERQP